MTADRTQTVTPSNPSPPTNFGSGGETPPTTATSGNVVPAADPTKFAPPTYGQAAEGAGTEVSDTPGTGTNSTLGRYVARPNSMHPSAKPDLEPTTLSALSPNSAPHGTDFMMRVYGSGFYTNAAIYLDGALVRNTVFMNSQMMIAPVKSTVAAGVHQVTVRKAGKETAALPLTLT